MARGQADIQALRELSTAIDRYQYEQRQVFTAARHEIESTRGSLERKAEKWRLRHDQDLWELADCERRSAAAAEHGGYLDCSPLARAAAEAAERLANVRTWQSRIEDEIAA